MQKIYRVIIMAMVSLMLFSVSNVEKAFCADLMKAKFSEINYQLGENVPNAKVKVVVTITNTGKLPLGKATKRNTALLLSGKKIIDNVQVGLNQTKNFSFLYVYPNEYNKVIAEKLEIKQWLDGQGEFILDSAGLRGKTVPANNSNEDTFLSCTLNGANHEHDSSWFETETGSDGTGYYSIKSEYWCNNGKLVIESKENKKYTSCKTGYALESGICYLKPIPKLNFNHSYQLVSYEGETVLLDASKSENCSRVTWKEVNNKATCAIFNPRNPVEGCKRCFMNDLSAGSYKFMVIGQNSYGDTTSEYIDLSIVPSDIPRYQKCFTFENTKFTLYNHGEKNFDDEIEIETILGKGYVDTYAECQDGEWEILPYDPNNVSYYSCYSPYQLSGDQCVVDPKLALIKDKLQQTASKYPWLEKEVIVNYVKDTLGYTAGAQDSIYNEFYQSNYTPIIPRFWVEKDVNGNIIPKSNLPTTVDSAMYANNYNGAIIGYLTAKGLPVNNPELTGMNDLFLSYPEEFYVRIIDDNYEGDSINWILQARSGNEYHRIGTNLQNLLILSFDAYKEFKKGEAEGFINSIKDNTEFIFHPIDALQSLGSFIYNAVDRGIADTLVFTLGYMTGNEQLLVEPVEHSIQTSEFVQSFIAQVKLQAGRIADLPVNQKAHELGKVSGYVKGEIAVVLVSAGASESISGAMKSEKVVNLLSDLKIARIATDTRLKARLTQYGIEAKMVEMPPPKPGRMPSYATGIGFEYTTQNTSTYYRFYDSNHDNRFGAWFAKAEDLVDSQGRLLPKDEIISKLALATEPIHIVKADLKAGLKMTASEVSYVQGNHSGLIFHPNPYKPDMTREGGALQFQVSDEFIKPLDNKLKSSIYAEFSNGITLDEACGKSLNQIFN